jgi:uncharacterized membrane protein YfcA
MMLEVALGFLIALAVGLTGVGGGTITVPVLILMLGVPAPIAVGTSLVFVTITKVLATPVYLFRGQVDLQAAKLLLLGGVPGVIAGAMTVTSMRAKELQPLVLTLVGGTIAVLALVSLYKVWMSPIELPRHDRRRWLPFLAAPIGLEVGFSSAGAGALGSLVLMHGTRMPANQIVGTDLLFGLALSAAGGALHAGAGNVDGALLTKLAAGGVLGALGGAWLGTWVPAKPLRAGLSLMMVYLGGRLLQQGVSGL